MLYGNSFCNDGRAKIIFFFLFPETQNLKIDVFRMILKSLMIHLRSNMKIIPKYFSIFPLGKAKIRQIFAK